MPHTIIIFGASVDLTNRKLIPALYLLFKKGRLPKETRVVGVALTKYSHDDWRKELTDTTRKFNEKQFEEAKWQEFAAGIFYQRGDIGSEADFAALDKFLAEIDKNQPSERLYYLATMPALYGRAVSQLGKAGLADDSKGGRGGGIEKAVGTDLAAAKGLNKEMPQL